MATLEAVIDARGARSGAAQFNAATNSMVRSATSTDRAVRGLANALRGLVVGLSVREFTRLNTTFTTLQNRVRVVTDSEEQLISTTEKLRQVAIDTRSSFEGTVTVFARTALFAEQLGRSQAELIQFTESLNRAIVISGASATEANAALIQLSQGIASNRLSGDELRSVLEQLPVVADVIARQLGVTRGELRALGQQGKITADVILDAFKNARQELSDRFGKTVPTIGQSLVQFRDAAVRAAGSASTLGMAFSEAAVFGANLLDTLVILNSESGKEGGIGRLLRNIREFNSEVGKAVSEANERQQALETPFAVANRRLMGLQANLAMLQRRFEESSRAGENTTAFAAGIANVNRLIEEQQALIDGLTDAGKRRQEQQEEQTRVTSADAKEAAERVQLLQLEFDLLRRGNEDAKDQAEAILAVAEARAAGDFELAKQLELLERLRIAIDGQTEAQKAAKEAAEDLADRDQEIASLEREIELTLQGADNARELADADTELADAVASGNTELADRLRKLAELNMQLADAKTRNEELAAAEREAAREARQQERALERVSELLAEDILDTLAEIREGTKSTGEAFRDLGEELLRFAANQALKQAIALIIQSAGSAGTGDQGGTNDFGALLTALFASKSGAVLSGNRVVPFQRGGVLDGPVTFPLAGQRVGVAGEAGFEGIFPLARDARGNLGVSAVGGGEGGRNVTVNQTIVTPDADSFRRSRRQVERDTVNAVREVN